jgi:hypothetical protein
MAETKTITIRDVQSLADRLLSRGSTKLLDDRPEQQGDMRLAATVIRALARSFNSADIISIENGQTTLTIDELGELAGRLATRSADLVLASRLIGALITTG